MRCTDMNQLDPRFKPLAEKLLENARAAGIDVVVIETRRTEAQHEEDVKNGVSWVKRSKHQDGLAIDIAPHCLMTQKNWAPASPLWVTLGSIGEALGLRWGGRWRQKDMGHFEYQDKP